MIIKSPQNNPLLYQFADNDHADQAEYTAAV